jgi:ubiquinone/menaquinone biosynthesis C-methylase UbiE
MAAQNAAMNRLAVAWLAAGADDAVLEIGFGPGRAIKRLVERTSAHSIAGVDLSLEMVEQAHNANRAAVDSGRVMLVRGSVAALPFEAGQFSRVFAVSNFHDWPARRAALLEVRRVLAGGGRLVLCLRRAPRHPHWWSSPGLSAHDLAADCELLRSVGFREVELRSSRLHRRIVGLLARR